MNAMLVYTASSWGVSASGIRLTAPTVPWMVSSNVRPVKTRIVSCFSLGVSVPHDGMSLDTGTFSGSQKLPVSRSQTSASFSSCRRFQLIEETRSISLSLSLTRSPFHAYFWSVYSSSIALHRHYNCLWPLTACDTTSCVAVSHSGHVRTGMLPRMRVVLVERRAPLQKGKASVTAVIRCPSGAVFDRQRRVISTGHEIGRRVRVPAQSLKDLPVPGARSQRNRGRRRAQSLAELQCLCGGARLAIYPMA